ncbi:MAG TPA: hypothetical protein PLX83_19430 [bacterium]|nr:hypothetical protein [bacterium]
MYFYFHRIGFASLIFAFWFTPLVPDSQGQESVEERVQKLEEENKALRGLVEDLQKRLDQLAPAKPEKPTAEEEKPKKKKEKEAAPAAVEPAAPAAGKAPPEAEAPPEKTKKDYWLPSLKGEYFSLGGRLQFEYFDPENETALRSAMPDNPNGSFKVDEFRIYLDADFKNNVRFHGKYDVEGEEGNLVETYVDFENLPLWSALRVGVQPRFYRPDRYTESYPLAGNAFWRKRDLGITWKGTLDPVYAFMSVSNGATLDREEVGEDQGDRLIGENLTELDFNGNKEFSAGLGLDLNLDPYGKLNLMGFGMVGDLSDEDLRFLQLQVPGYGFRNDDQREMAGVNLDYRIDEWDFFAQAIGRRDGELERFGWYTELSYKFNFKGMRYLNSLRPLVRYGELDTNLTPQPFIANGSLTWDREQWLFAVIAELVRNVSFRAEYMLNEEKTGGPGAQNNELLFQLEIVF